jgi:hypothetical protein
MELLKALGAALVQIINSELLLTALSSLVLTFVSWGVLRLVNLSKRNSKYAILWALVKQAARFALDGESKKAWVKVKFHDLCHNTWLKRVLGAVPDAVLDLQIENFYLKLQEQNPDFSSSPSA